MKKLLLAVAAVAAMVFGAVGVTKDDYAMKFTVTIADGVGDKTAENAVIPIRLSESTINGFKYNDFNETDGTDLYITDGNDTRLDYEIDMWNPSGETTVWVKVPAIAAGTVLTVYYKGAKNTDNNPKAVWSLFLGVWHFNETSVNGTSANAYEATGNAALTGYDTPKTTSVNGLFGLARSPRMSNYGNSGVGGVFLPAMKLNGKFAISGWFNIANCGYPTFFSTKETFADSGFHYYIRSTWNMGNLELLGDERSDGWNSASTGSKVALNSWNRYCIVHDDETAGANFWLYIDGEKTGQGNKGHGTVTDNGNEICVGNVSCDAAKEDNGPGCSAQSGETGAGRSFCGMMDEIRIQSYENFDANREYFEGVIAKDGSLCDYSVASQCGSLEVNLSFEVIESMAPAKIAFTATVEGASGSCTYSWDFNNDGEIDRVGDKATEIWECVIPGKYNARVCVVDSAGTPGEITTLDTYIVNGTFYADGGASENGNGTEEYPFNNLCALAAKMNTGDKAFVRGTFIVGNAADDVPVFNAGSIVIASWPGETGKAVVAATNGVGTVGTALFFVKGAGTTISNLVFAIGAPAISNGRVLDVLATDVTLSNCDFSLLNNQGSGWSRNGVNGVIFSSDPGVNARMTVRDCTFADFNNKGIGQDYKLICCGYDARIVGNTFTNCANVLWAASSWATFQFVSNLVVDTANNCSTDPSNTDSGALMRGKRFDWDSGCEVAYNIFLNATKGGYLVNDKTGTDQAFSGLTIHHNTIVGYDGIIQCAANAHNGSRTIVTIADNLLTDAGCVLEDLSPTAWMTDKIALRNNAIKSGEDVAVLKVTSGLEGCAAVVVDNRLLAELPRFSNTTDPASPDFYRPKATSKRDPLVAGGWTDDGKYPAYIGAVEPLVIGGFTLYIQ